MGEERRWGGGATLPLPVPPAAPAPPATATALSPGAKSPPLHLSSAALAARIAGGSASHSRASRAPAPRPPAAHAALTQPHHSTYPGPAGPAGPAGDKREAMVAFIRKFRSRYEINPFRQEEGEGFLRTRTHNRRRWSHIFPQVGPPIFHLCPPRCLTHTTPISPQGTLEHVGYYGLNWKVRPILCNGPLSSPLSSPN